MPIPVDPCQYSTNKAWTFLDVSEESKHRVKDSLIVEGLALVLLLSCWTECACPGRTLYNDLRSASKQSSRGAKVHFITWTFEGETEFRG